MSSISSVRYSNSRWDTVTFSALASVRNRGLWIIGFVGSALISLPQWNESLKGASLPVALVSVGFLFALVFLVLLTISALANVVVAAVSQNPGFFTEHSIVLTEEGVREETHLGHQFVRWKGVVRVQNSGRFIQVFIASNMAHLIPRRAFPDDSAFEQFYQTCRERMEAARALEGGKP